MRGAGRDAVRQIKKVSKIAPAQHRSGREELTPCGQRSGATVLEILAADEGAFLIEVVVNGAVQSGELLHTSHAPQAQHRPFPSSEWLMGILGPVVQPAAGFPFAEGSKVLQGHAVGRQAIGHDRLGLAMSSKRFSEEFQRSLLVPPLGDEAFEHLAFMIDGTPEVVLHPVDLHEHLVEMPAALPSCCLWLSRRQRVQFQAAILRQ